MIGAVVGDATRTSRFLWGLHEFRVRPDDVFISSYPRSGTTWMQHILHVLRSRGDVSFQHISDVVPWFERSLALGRRRARDFEALPSPRMFKSHLPRMWLPAGARYVYVARDGCDVALSYYHFYCSHLSYRGDFDAFFERFLVGSLQYGSWFRHVTGWHAHNTDPDVLLVRYEQLQRALPRELQRIAAFYGQSLDAGMLKSLSELCQFSFMREHETKFDHACAEPRAPAHVPGTFIRRGRSGEAAQALSAAQLFRYQERLESVRPSVWELNLPAFLH
jgi:hypothetical protein